ncbi:hypothetical protein [Bacillus pseudomycoides]|uniref:hypothetical protein n=1 Tax=Bacillus pseudomycoides TaxID=64104 RepID=UPI0015CEF6C0|nr:hypothetical protein [Bacillus pseudomycoides]
MSQMEKHLQKKKRQEKLDMIYNHTVQGEGYFQSPSYNWKSIVIQYFNKIQRKEMTVEQLVNLLEKEGVKFSQPKALIHYPVIDCLKYIAKVSKENLEL